MYRITSLHLATIYDIVVSRNHSCDFENVNISAFP